MFEYFGCPWMFVDSNGEGEVLFVDDIGSRFGGVRVFYKYPHFVIRESSNITVHKTCSCRNPKRSLTVPEIRQYCPNFNVEILIVQFLATRKLAYQLQYK